MTQRKTGRFRIISTAGEECRAFIPEPLPPKPPLHWNDTLRGKFNRAMHALGQLDTISTVLPDAHLFIYTYVRKEAVLSSQIEGTQSSLSDLILHEQGKKTRVPVDDVVEVSNYVAALEHAQHRLKEGFPLSLRLIREMHEKLLQTGRGHRRTPGEFRRSQNWVGGTRPGNATYVPPPPEELMSCLDALEKFLHDDPVATTPLEKAALAHVQFESIHPFLDGNGRIGRLLIVLLLQLGGLLQKPVLYLSLYFKRYRNQYYEKLQAVREQGDWEGWLSFFADGIVETAMEAVQTANQLSDLVRTHRAFISEAFGKQAGSALLVHEALSKRVIAPVKTLVEDTGLTSPTVRSILDKMLKNNMVEEVTGKQRERVYSYAPYYAIMDEDNILPEKPLY